MKSKYTPGPWIAYRVENKIQDLHGNLIFKPYPLINQKDLDLIAAAPNMLGLLKKVNKFFKNMERKGKIEPSVISNQVKWFLKRMDEK